MGRTSSRRRLGSSHPIGPPNLGVVPGFVVLFLVVAGAAVLISWLVERAKRMRAAAVAVAQGLQYLPGPTSPPDVPFRLFSVGRSRKVRHTFWRAGDSLEATVFLYQYTTGSGKEPLIPAQGWPIETYFTATQELVFNGEPIQMIHMPNAHTDGDSVIFFRRADVIATGDLFNTTKCRFSHKFSQKHLRGGLLIL